MYEFIKTATGWRIYWGPPPREEARQELTTSLVLEAAEPKVAPVTAALEILAVSCRA